jgi:hypothetical protein
MKKSADTGITAGSNPQRADMGKPSLRTQVRRLKAELKSAELLIRVGRIHLERAWRPRDALRDALELQSSAKPKRRRIIGKLGS